MISLIHQMITSLNREEFRLIDSHKHNFITYNDASVLKYIYIFILKIYILSNGFKSEKGLSIAVFLKCRGKVLLL